MIIEKHIIQMSYVLILPLMTTVISYRNQPRLDDHNISLDLPRTMDWLSNILKGYNIFLNIPNSIFNNLDKDDNRINVNINGVPVKWNDHNYLRGWSKWSACSVICGHGKRTRTCTNSGGKQCIGNKQEYCFNNKECEIQSGGVLGDSGMMTSTVMQPSAVSAIAYGNAQFGQRLYEIMRKKEEGSNLLMSPYSVSSVMAMASLGARGDTLREMRTVMEFPSNKKLVAGYSNVLKVLRGNENFTLETANKLFVQYGYHLVNDFVKVLKERFYAEATQTNFYASEEARKLINDWVEHKTKKTIKELIPSGVLDGMTKLVLVNAIYFKGDWARKFDKQDTFDGNFYVEENKVVKTKMMHKYGFTFKMINIKKLNAKAVELPYKGDRVSMYILLPNDKFGLADVETKLFKIKIHKLFSKVDASKETKINIILPKFKLEKSINLKDYLKQLGMVQMFGALADFSGITGNTELYVSAILQKAFIEVNEEGSEASAATTIITRTRSFQIVPEFVCDHPFIFFIKDKKTDMVLFSGRIMNPT